MHTDALNTDPDSCPPEVKPRPMKTIYIYIAATKLDVGRNELDVSLRERERERKIYRNAAGD